VSTARYHARSRAELTGEICRLKAQRAAARKLLQDADADLSFTQGAGHGKLVELVEKLRQALGCGT
jgi:hypothetical protein